MYNETTKLLYNKLPEIYRVADFREGNNTLLRYLSALDEGGLENLRQDINRLYSIMSIEKAPTEAIPLLGKMLGFNYIQDLDDRTQRKIVENLAELYKRKGTKSVIHFIAREFTEGEVKIVETENRMFRTWAKESKLVPPSERRILSRTFNGRKVNENTFYLVSKEGKYTLNSVLILIESLTDLPLLDRLLIEFLPVNCKVYLQLTGIERFEESMTLHSPSKNTEITQDQETTPVNIAEGNAKLNMYVLDKEKSSMNNASHHIQLEKTHKDIMKAIIDDALSTMTLTETSVDESRLTADSTNIIKLRDTDEEETPLESTDQTKASLTEKMSEEEIDLDIEDVHKFTISESETEEEESETEEDSELDEEDNELNEDTELERI